MKIITLNLPERYLSSIKSLIDFGVVPSRSEAVRLALGDFLQKELHFYVHMEENEFRTILRGAKN